MVRGGAQLIYAAAIMRCMFRGVHVRISNSNAEPNVKHAAVGMLGAFLAVTFGFSPQDNDPKRASKP